IPIDLLDEFDMPTARRYAPDSITRLVQILEMLRHMVDVFRRHDYRHTDSHIEDAIHLRLFDIAHPLHRFEDRQDGPTSALVGCDAIFGKYARNIFEKSSSGQMSKTFDRATVEKPSERGQVVSMRFQKLFADRAAQFVQICIGFVAADIEEDLTSKAVSVRVEPKRRQPEQNVSR